jgi:two-component system NtrC family sensor kinase
VTTTGAPADLRPAVAVVGGAAERRARVADELTGVAARAGAPLLVAPTPAGLPGTAPVGVLVVVPGPDERADDLLLAVAGGDGRPAPRGILVTAASTHGDVHAAVDAGRLQIVVTDPWTPGAFAGQVAAQLQRWHRATRSDADPETLELHEGAEHPDSRLLRDLELDPAALTRRLLDGIESVLGHRVRLELPPGVRLTRQGVGVDGVFVVLAGSVALDRSSEVGELRLHHASTGPVVGLLSLTQRRRAFFTARTTTDVEVVHLSLEQLDRSLATSPDVGSALTAASVQALARRLRRSERLQVERTELAEALAHERAGLAEALRLLEDARLELVESARFATLGELSAGIAHELNNPVAALARATEHLGADLDQLLLDHPDGTLLRRGLDAARTRAPRSTAEERRLVRTVGDAVADRALGRDLVAAGVEDPSEAAALVRDHDRATLRLLATAAGVGTSLRNLRIAAGRISELVASVRAYARPTTEAVPDVDVAASLDDTIALLAHRLRTCEVVRDYRDVPPLRGHPGQLSQVWSNLLTNAAEAAGAGGRLVVATDAPDPAHVRVTIADDGPGIDAEVAARLFEPRFTTKQGVIRYGLGLGLAIAKRVVDAHGGTISVAGTAEGTVATVVLPVAGPPEEDVT